MLIRSMLQVAAFYLLLSFAILTSLSAHISTNLCGLLTSIFNFLYWQLVRANNDKLEAETTTRLQNLMHSSPRVVIGLSVLQLFKKGTSCLLATPSEIMLVQTVNKVLSHNYLTHLLL